MRYSRSSRRIRRGPLPPTLPPVCSGLVLGHFSD